MPLSWVSTLGGHSGCVNRLAWSDEGSVLASVSDDRSCLLWRWGLTDSSIPACWRMHAASRIQTSHGGNIFGVGFLGGPEAVVTAAADGVILLHSLRQGSAWETTTLARRASRIKSLATAGPMEPTVAFAAVEGSSEGVPGCVVAVDAREPPGRVPGGNCIVAPRGRRGWLEVKSVSAGLDGHLLAVGCEGLGDECVRLYDRRTLSSMRAEESDTSRALRFAPLHIASSRRTEHVTHVALGNDNQLLAYYHCDGIYIFGINGSAVKKVREGVPDKGGGDGEAQREGLPGMAPGAQLPASASLRLRSAHAAARSASRPRGGGLPALAAATRDAAETLLERGWRGDGSAAVAAAMALISLENGAPSAQLLLARSLASCGQAAAGRMLARSVERAGGAAAGEAAHLLASGVLDAPQPVSRSPWRAALHAADEEDGSEISGGDSVSSSVESDGGNEGGGRDGGRDGGDGGGGGGSGAHGGSAGGASAGGGGSDGVDRNGGALAAAEQRPPPSQHLHPPNPCSDYPVPHARLSLPRGGGGATGLCTRFTLRCAGSRNRATDIKEASFAPTLRGLALRHPRDLRDREVYGKERGSREHATPIVAGSDCGHALVWGGGDGELIEALPDDEDVCNAVCPHPTLPLLASSGIGTTVRLWAPTTQADASASRRTRPTLFDAESLATLAAMNAGRTTDDMGELTLSAADIARLLRQQAGAQGGDAVQCPQM